MEWRDGVDERSRTTGPEKPDSARLSQLLRGREKGVFSGRRGERERERIGIGRLLLPLLHTEEKRM